MVLTVAMFVGIYAYTSYQFSYASILHAEDSDYAIFFLSLEFQLDNSVSQNNNCVNSQVNPGNGIVLLEEIGNSSESTATVSCSNTALVR